MNDEITSAGSVPASNIPTNEYERFLAALPDEFREECRNRLSGSGFSPDHPVFQALADFYEKAQAPTRAERDFIGEATLHADRSKQLLDDFQSVPRAILAQIEPQLVGLLSALNDPVAKLESTATHLQRNVEALPVLLLGNRPSLSHTSMNRWDKWKWWFGEWSRLGRSIFASALPWIVCGSISVTVALAAATIVLVVGASRLSQAYEDSYQQRLAHLESDSVQNTITLNRLLSAGIALKVERSKEGNSYFLVLPGAHKAAQPVNSPEGLAIEVWP